MIRRIVMAMIVLCVVFVTATTVHAQSQASDAAQDATESGASRGAEQGAGVTPLPNAIFQPQNNQFKIPITMPQLAFGLGECTFDGAAETRCPNFAERLFSFIVDLLQRLAGILAFGYFLYGAFRYMTAGGDPAKVTAARNIMIGSIIGIIIVALSFVLVAYLREVFQTEILT